MELSIEHQELCSVMALAALLNFSPKDSLAV